MNYQVIVGNVGTVYDGDDRGPAEAAFDRYSEMADISTGSRCYGESVVLMVDGDIAREHASTRDAD